MAFLRLTFPCVMMACLRFDGSKLDSAAHSSKHLDKLVERIYLMTYQAELIKEGSWCIFTKLFQCFHIHINMWRSIKNWGKTPPGTLIFLSNSLRSLWLLVHPFMNLFFSPQWTFLVVMLMINSDNFSKHCSPASSTELSR